MEAGAPNSGVVNMTRAIEALSPMLNNPRKTITQVQVLVSVAAALLLLQFILGFCKRLWHNSIVSFVLKVCSKVMFPLIVYTLGTMQTSAIKNSVYPVWAFSLIMASGAAGAVKQSHLPTVENLMSLYIEVARYLFYGAIFCGLLGGRILSWSQGQPQFRRPNASFVCIYLLFIFILVSKVIEGFAELMFGFSYTRRVAIWTKKNLKNDSRSMNEYNYLVRYPLSKGFRAASNDQVTTVDQIWNCFKDSDDGTPADDKKILADICLSFALFELLKRRYFGCIWAEASLQTTQDFIFKELLSNPDDDYKRAFRIVETELEFFYDFLFTKHQLIYAAGLALRFWIIWFVLFMGKIILIFVVVVYALNNSLILETPNPIIEVHSAKADYLIALAFLCIILLVKLLEAAFYLASDWFKVSLTCMYVKRKSCAHIAFVYEKIVAFLSRITISARLSNKIGQCSFIFDRSQLINSTDLVMSLLRKNHVKVSDAVKKAIAKSLKSTAGKLTNGEKSIKEHGLFAWTLKDHSQIEAMLIWHIATDYCVLAFSDGGEDRNVAVHLSRCYAYLIAFVGGLLPYHVAYIRELADTVTEEVRILAFHTSSEMKDTMKRLQGTEETDEPTTIFAKGVKLGKQLEKWSNDKRDKPWKMLAEFWAESIIYITPSHCTTMHHMSHLESGGEFLTQIWVLLSHAGILNLDREKDQGPKPTQPETA